MNEFYLDGEFYSHVYVIEPVILPVCAARQGGPGSYDHGRMTEIARHDKHFCSFSTSVQIDMWC